jgi:hypothetical protein
VHIRVAGLLEAAAIVTLALGSAAVVFLLSRGQSAGVDFAPLWAAAANPEVAYDVAVLTSVQPDLFDFDAGLRPFAYPPTALLLLVPFGSMPFAIACGLFIAAGVGLFGLAAMRSGARWWVMLFPPVVTLAFAGQASLLVAALSLASLGAGHWRVRGALAGLALAIKPQVIIFLPIALLFERDFRSLAAAIAVLLALSAGATFAFGLSVWSDWLAALLAIREVVETSPQLSADMLQTRPTLSMIPAAVAVWLTRRSPPPARFGVVAASSLLVAPYAMEYELALLAPALALGFSMWLLLPALVVGLGFMFISMPALLVGAISVTWSGISLSGKPSLER